MSRKLYVVSGPSGAGIREIAAAVFARRDDLAAPVPVTARKMKPGEADGVGYFFYDLEGWNALKETGDLLEGIEFAGNDYGTSRRQVERVLAVGKNALLELGVERAAQLKANMPEAVCVYIEPSASVLEARYRAVSHSALECALRLETAARERALSDFCDARLNSDDLAAAADALDALIGR